MQRIKEAYKRTASSDDDVFTTPGWISKRSRARMTAYKRAAAASDVARRMEAFERPAVIIQPGDAGSIDDVEEIESPASPPPEGCPLTQPDSIDDVEEIESPASPPPEGCPPTQESESSTPMPMLYVLPDATVIASPHDTVAVFRPLNPDEVMTQDVCNVILEEVMLRKVTLEYRNSRLSLETVTRNVCQDVAVTITSTEWQKEVRQQIQSR